MLIIKNRMSAAIIVVMSLYIFFNFIWFPKRRNGTNNSPSGIHTVTGKTHDEVFDLGRDEDGNVYAVQHGDEDDDVCFHYDGILLISYADEDGFATVFFLFVMNQLLYAEKHNLLPWIHLDGPTNIKVYDPKEHGNSEEDAVQLGVTVLNGLQYDTYVDPKNGQSYDYPGDPILNYKDSNSITKEVRIDGTGIWSSYFDPPSRLDPLRHLVHYQGTDSSCHKLPIFQLTLQQIEPSLMVFSPWAIRAWRRKSTPPGIARWKDMSYQQWFDPMRRTAHDMIRKHYSPTEEMTLLAHQTNPVVASEEACLALHIRYSDKADRREPIPIDEFRPYVEAYQQAAIWVGTTIVIYVATDSNHVIEQLHQQWPSTLTSYMRFQAVGSVIRSDNKTAVFDMTTNHHQTNKEVFTDILAMAECEFMVHGMSAVTEAVHYLNLRLHNQSVNLEEEAVQTAGGGNGYIHKRKATMSPAEFGTLVRNRLHEKRKATVAHKKDMDHGV